MLCLRYMHCVPTQDGISLSLRLLLLSSANCMVLWFALIAFDKNKTKVIIWYTVLDT